MSSRLLIVLFAVAFVGCGDDGDNGYFPLRAGAQWVMQGWQCKDLPDGEPEELGWYQNNKAWVAGTERIDDQDWRVVQFTDGTSTDTLMMRSSADELSLLGIAPGEYTGDPATILQPDGGPLLFVFEGAEQFDVQQYDFTVDAGTYSVQARIEIEEIGTPIETGSGRYEDGLTLRFAACDAPCNPAEAEPWLRIRLAKGQGPVHIEHHMTNKVHWGDIVRE